MINNVWEVPVNERIPDIKHQLSFKTAYSLPYRKKSKDGIIEEIHAVRAAANSHLILVSRRAKQAINAYLKQKKQGTITLSDADIRLLNMVFDQIGIKRLSA